MKPMSWSDQMGSRSRTSWLLLIKDGKVQVFSGSSLPGWAVVRSSKFVRQGKWSHTTYELALADDVRAIAGRQGWETNTFAEGIASVTRAAKTPTTWPEMAACFGVEREAAEAFLRAWKPKAAELLDNVEAELAALEAASGPSCPS